MCLPVETQLPGFESRIPFPFAFHAWCAMIPAIGTSPLQSRSLMKAPFAIRRSARFLIVMASCVSFAHAVAGQPPGNLPAPAAPKNLAADAPGPWMEWAKWVDARHPVADPQGHGPDIGSDEWARALDKQLEISDAQGHGPDLKSGEWRNAVEFKLLKKPAAPAAIDRQLLSAHDTVARFTGIKDHRCMGRTALCPDRCGHSGKLATFAIVKYLRYEKPGEFGDPRQEQFRVLIEDNMNQPKVPAAILKSINTLKAGDLVRLAWNHDYVTRDGSKSPERPIVSISPLTKEQADKLPGIADDAK
jgi:hypothetical protein